MRVQQHSVAVCLHCGKRFEYGASIPALCRECSASGHDDGSYVDCRKCRPPDDDLLLK